MPDTIESRINAQKAVVDGLITAANNKTGDSFANLPAAVEELIDGYHSGGEQIFYTQGNQGYTKNTELPYDVIRASMFSGATELETISMPELTNMSADTIFDGCSKLRTLHAPKITNLFQSYLGFRNCTNLTEVVVGSVGYAVNPTSVLSRNTFNLSNARNLTVTMYVSASNYTEIPANITANMPWGAPSTASVIFRNSETGEVIPVE